MAIKFDEKPSRAVLDKMHDAGWVWKQADRIWAHAVTPESAMSTRIKAERLYQEVLQDDPAGEGHRSRTGSTVLIDSRSRGDL